MSGSRFSAVLVSVLMGILVSASWSPVEGQLRRLRQAAERAAEREVERQVERAVTGMVRCAFNDPACIEEAKENGDAVEITDEDGNVLRDANGNPISDPEYARASREKPGQGAWRNYDFVPGERTLFHEDFSADNVGDFPRRIEFLAGNMEVVDSDGMRILRVTGGSQRDAQFAIPLPEMLPDRFTLEFPVHWAARNLYVRVYFAADGAPKPARGGTYQRPHLVVDHRQTGIYDWQEDSPYATEPVRGIHDGWVTVRLMADGDHVKAYVNEKRVANIPQADLGRDSKLWFTLRDGTDEVPIFVGPITVAAGGRDLYDRLEAEGTIATRGILFALDSDQILPESTPTLEEIGGMLRDHPDLRLGIVGHTDSQGSDDYNRDLSERRAASVVRYLVDAFEIDSSRLEASGMGETAPVDTNDTAEGRANNRRVELTDLRDGAATRSAGPAEGMPARADSPAPVAPATAAPPPASAAEPRPATDATRPVASSAAPQAAGSFEGQVTISLGGASETLPVTGGTWDPDHRDDPEFGDSGLARFHIEAGEVLPSYDGTRRPAAFILLLTVDERSLQLQRGEQRVEDYRVTPVNIENFVAAFDMPADSDLRFTIEAYEARDGVGYVRGRFTGTDIQGGRPLSGTFEAVVPRAR